MNHITRKQVQEKYQTTIIKQGYEKQNSFPVKRDSPEMQGIMKKVCDHFHILSPFDCESKDVLESINSPEDFFNYVQDMRVQRQANYQRPSEDDFISNLDLMGQLGL